LTGVPDPEDSAETDDPMSPEEEARLLEIAEAAKREPGKSLILADARDIEYLL